MRLPIATVMLALAGGAALGFACGSAARPRQPKTLAAGDGLLAGGGGWLFGGPDGYGYGYGYGYGGPGYAGGRGYGAGYGAPLYGGDPYASPADRGTTYGGYRFDPAKVARPDRAYVPRYRDYEPRATGPRGTIAGRVRWPKPPAAAARLAGPCAGTVNPTLRLAAGGAVIGAVVHLSDIRSGRAYFGNEPDALHGRAALRLGGTLTRDACGFTPQVQLAAPLGAWLDVEARGGTCALRGLLRERFGSRELFHAALDQRGGQVRIPLEQPGPIEIACDADHGATSAWVFVQRHPYHVLSDDAGRFRLEEVPPGTYRLAVWHAPVLLGHEPDGTPRFTAPAISESTVTVRADRVTSVELTLP